ncbi:MAG: metal ABC transporter permease [Myxococcota bacterium]|nr:metal ABC transporter permease [Myxococcota bacterium]
MWEALSLPFFQRVLIAGLLASVACGVIGSYVVSKRIASLTGGLSHAAFGGVGLGYWAGLSPLIGAAGFGLVASMIIGMAHRKVRSGLDILIAMVWSVGMALGIIFIALTPGYVPDLMSYLFGSLLFVSWADVGLVAIVDVIILSAVFLFHPLFETICFDEEYAEASGMPAGPTLLTLLGLASLAIVTLLRVVGVILAIALLTMPAATARRWVGTLPAMMVLSVGLCAASIAGGLFLSYGISGAWGLSIPPGPLIILIATITYVSSIALPHRRHAETNGNTLRA